MGRHVITPLPDTEQEQATRPDQAPGTDQVTDQPGPGTRGAARAEREQQQADTPSSQGWIVGVAVAVAALVAIAIGLAASNDRGVAPLPANDDEVAALQAEKELVTDGRQQAAGAVVGTLPQDDSDTLQGEKEAVVSGSVNQSTLDVSGSDQHLHNQAAQSAPDVTGSDQHLHNQAAQSAGTAITAVPDDTDLQHEKEAVLVGTTSQVVPASNIAEASTLADEKATWLAGATTGDNGRDEPPTSQEEKELVQDRAAGQASTVPPQAEEAAVLAQEKQQAN